MSKKLTKEYLMGIGLTVQYPNVYKTTSSERWNNERTKKLCKQVTYAGADEIKYIYYSVWNEGKMESITEARMVYAWYYGEVPENCDVMHKNGNILDNQPSNLVLSPRKGRKMLP